MHSNGRLGSQIRKKFDEKSKKIVFKTNDVINGKKFNLKSLQDMC